MESYGFCDVLQPFVTSVDSVSSDIVRVTKCLQKLFALRKLLHDVQKGRGQKSRKGYPCLAHFRF